MSLSFSKSLKKFTYQIECILDEMELAYNRRYKQAGSIYNESAKPFIDAMEFIEKAKMSLKTMRKEIDV